MKKNLPVRKANAFSSLLLEDIHQLNCFKILLVLNQSQPRKLDFKTGIFHA